MPNTPTVLATAEGTGTSSLTTASISPAADSLILVLVQGASGGGVTPNSCSSTFSVVTDGQGRDWHPIYNYYSDPDTLNYTDQRFGSDNVTHQLWWAVTTSSPGSGTVTFGTSAGIAVLRGQVLEVTGDIDLDDPVRQYQYTGSASSGTSITDNLDYAVLSDSLLVSFLSGRNAGGSVSPDTGWTELSEYTTNSFSTNIQHRASTTATQYGGSFTSTQPNGRALSSVEIRADAGAVPPPTVENEYQFESSANTQTVPETGSVTLGANEWVLLGILTRGGGVARTVSTVTSTFDVTGAGWQRSVQTASTGSANIRAEWWYAQVAASGTLSGAITITWDSSWWGVKGAYILSFPSADVADPPIGETLTVTQGTNLAGGTFLTGTYGTAPAATSRILTLGVSSPNSTQLFSRPRMGYTYIGPPTDEGGSHTRFLSHGQGDSTVGGRFGLSTPGHDATEGAVWASVEIQAPASGVSIPVIQAHRRSQGMI